MAIIKKNMMLYLTIALGLVSAIAVSDTDPYRNILETEVAKLKTFVNDTASRVNASAFYQVSGRMGTSLACWSIELGTFNAQINNAIDDYLSDYLKNVTDLLAQTKTMTDEQIQQLAIQLYGSSDSVLIQLGAVETEFNNRSQTIYTNLMQLSKITCNSTVTATAKKP